MDEALIYETLDGKKVRCNLCNFRCVISEGKTGICKVRINKDGKLFTLLNSYVSSWALDPIEKKPVFIFILEAPYFHLAHGVAILDVGDAKIMKFQELTNLKMSCL